jgi:hypothetical protein
VISRDLNEFDGKDDKYGAKLAQLRIGNPTFTVDRLDALWPRKLHNKARELMVAPLTLLAAAHLWDLISPSDRPPIPVDRLYMNAWHRHRLALGTSQWQALPPTIGWPGNLNRGLEIPAPG